MKWDDGLTVTVFPPEEFTSSYPQEGAQAVKWRITITNGSDDPYRGSLTVNVKAGDEGVQCEQIFDSANHVGGGIDGSISPGSSGTAEFGFDVPRAQLAKVDLEVSPSWSHEGLHWVGPVNSQAGSS